LQRSCRASHGKAAVALTATAANQVRPVVARVHAEMACACEASFCIDAEQEETVWFMVIRFANQSVQFGYLTSASSEVNETFYANPWATDITAINPYAAYDLPFEAWTVAPDPRQHATVVWPSHLRPGRSGRGRPRAASSCRSAQSAADARRS
jgi:hypothetical protein